MSHTVVGVRDVENALRELGIEGRPIEVHVSVRSFGGLEDGPATIVDGVLAAGSTVLAATMASDQFGIPAPPDDRPAQNGIDYETQASIADDAQPTESIGTYDSTYTGVSAWLGAFSAHVAARPDRIRCRYAAGEFSAVGPLASRLIDAETDADVFGPLRALVEEDGAVVLMGVGLTRLTLLHLAEVDAGRRPFIRWGRGRDARAVRVRVGECSEGFESLASSLAPVERRLVVGASEWRMLPARKALKLAADAIRANPSITHCPNPECIECADAIAGGPLE
ncbi:MAG: aminoglycoside 3-N-acetyltransferase [Actinomycetota bacterium]